MRVLCSFCVVPLIALLSPAPVAAQLGAASINRPSAGPSQRIGLIGQTGGAVTGRGSSLDPFSNLRRNDFGAASAAIPGASGFGAARGGFGFRRNSDPTSTSLQPSSLGARWGEARRGGVGRVFQTLPSEGALRSMSGIDSAMSYERPAGIPLQGEPLLTRPTLPQMTNSPYHDFFGIIPAEAAPYQEIEPINPHARPESLADRANQALLSSRAPQRDAAAETFREAMGAGTVAQRAQTLDRAAQMLEKSKRRNPQDFLPRLLLAHVAFERAQVAYGLENLAEAVRCNPELFVQKTDVGAYCGDRTVYERQLRRYIQAGSQENAPPEATILEAYCAFMLNDTARAASAADAAQKKARERSYTVPMTRDDVSVLAFAIKAATAQ